MKKTTLLITAMALLPLAVRAETEAAETALRPIPMEALQAAVQKEPAPSNGTTQAPQKGAREEAAPEEATAPTSTEPTASKTPKLILTRRGGILSGDPDLDQLVSEIRLLLAPHVPNVERATEKREGR